MALIIVLHCCAPAGAQELLDLRLEPVCAAPRSHAPVLVTATLEYRGAALMEGTLRVILQDHGITVCELRIPDVVLAAGTDYSTLLVFPPMPSPATRVLDVLASFETVDGVIPLGVPDNARDETSYLSLLAAPGTERGLTLGVCTGGVTGYQSANQSFLQTALGFEEYLAPPEPQQRLDFGTARSSPAQLPAKDLPADPLALCAFDVVLLVDGGLGVLRESQLTAVLDWVRAGGGLCVVPDGRLQAIQAQFLTELVSEVEDAPTPVLANDGLLVGFLDQPLVADYGLGRVVLLPPVAALRDVLTDDQKQELSAALWRVRLDQPRAGDELWRAGALLKPVEQDDADDDARANEEQRLREDQLMRMRQMTLQRVSATGLVDRLMPQSVRLVPLPLVTCLLIAYVVVVGPGDYLLLGMLGLRRLTWIVFPVVTVLFTVLLVGLSNAYMATTESGGSMVIEDVVRGGRIARRTSLKLEFHGARRELREPQTKRFLTHVDFTFPADDWSAGAVDPTWAGDSTGLYYEGRVPARYTAVRTVSQWKPQLTRTLEIAPESCDPVLFDWDAAVDFASPSARKKLAERIRDAWGAGATAWLLHGDDDPIVLCGTDEFFQSEEMWNYFSKVWETPPDFMRVCCRRPANGLFSVVSRVSPTGADNYEDLTLLDSSDPDQWVLIVGRWQGNELRVRRRLYQGVATGQSAADEEGAAAVEMPGSDGTARSESGGTP